jgi:hypothetical protein
VRRAGDQRHGADDRHNRRDRQGAGAQAQAVAPEAVLGVLLRNEPEPPGVAGELAAGARPSASRPSSWHGLVAANDSLTRALDARLLAEHRMPVSAVEALIEIAHADEGSISVSELAQRIRLSPT